MTGSSFSLEESTTLSPSTSASNFPRTFSTIPRVERILFRILISWSVHKRDTRGIASTRIVMPVGGVSNTTASYPLRATNFLIASIVAYSSMPVSYTHLRAHETRHDLVCRLLLEKKKKNTKKK